MSSRSKPASKPPRGAKADVSSRQTCTSSIQNAPGRFQSTVRSASWCPFANVMAPSMRPQPFETSAPLVPADHQSFSTGAARQRLVRPGVSAFTRALTKYRTPGSRCRGSDETLTVAPFGTSIRSDRPRHAPSAGADTGAHVHSSIRGRVVRTCQPTAPSSNPPFGTRLSAAGRTDGNKQRTTIRKSNLTANQRFAPSNIASKTGP